MRNSLFFFLFIVSFSFASTFFISSSGATAPSVYNAQIEDVSPPLRFLWSGEKANVHVSGLGTYHIEFGDKGEVLKIAKGECPDSTLKISLSKNTLAQINSKEITLAEAVHRKQLSFKSNTVPTELKLQTALGFITAGGTWNNIFGPKIDKLFSLLPF